MISFYKFQGKIANKIVYDTIVSKLPRILFLFLTNFSYQCVLNQTYFIYFCISLQLFKEKQQTYFKYNIKEMQNTYKEKLTEQCFFKHLH